MTTDNIVLPATVSFLAAVDITNPSFKANPFPFYAQLRAEAPVFPVTVKIRRQQRAWLVTRYEDVVNVLKDERFAKNPANAMTTEQLKKAPKMPPFFKPLSRGLLSLDKPDHTRLRALVHRAFTPRMIENMRDQIQLLTNELLDKIEGKKQVDLLADFALPLPLTMISRILGIPEVDTPKFHRWTRIILSGATNRNLFQLVPAVIGMMSYLRKTIRARSKEPRNDLITALAQAREGDDKLTEDEILAMIFLLLSAGHETTVNLIGSGTLALLQHPDQLTKLRQDPGLGKSAVEEIVRYVCPAETATERYACEDIEIAGVTIPRGELVLAVVASANRDEAYFNDPETFDITRQNNKHLGFGQGIHYCIGAPLARLEGQIALTTLAQRFPNLRLAVPPEDLRWRGSLILRGLETLPVTF